MARHDGRFGPWPSLRGLSRRARGVSLAPDLQFSLVWPAHSPLARPSPISPPLGDRPRPGSTTATSTGSGGRSLAWVDRPTRRRAPLVWRGCSRSAPAAGRPPGEPKPRTAQSASTATRLVGPTAGPSRRRSEHASGRRAKIGEGPKGRGGDCAVGGRRDRRGQSKTMARRGPDGKGPKYVKDV